MIYLESLKKEGILSLKQRSDKEAQIGQFLFNLLTKRLLSDPYAFACTWWNKIVIETDDVATLEEVNYAYKRVEHLVEYDIEKEQREKNSGSGKESTDFPEHGTDQTPVIRTGRTAVPDCTALAKMV